MISALLRRLLQTALCAGLATLAAPAAAQSCGVTGSTSASIGTYNPFSATGFNEVSFTLRLTRLTASALSKTRSVNFYLVESGELSGLDIRHRGEDVLHSPARAPYPSLLFPPSGTIQHSFGSIFSPDTASIPLTISIPPGMDLTASSTLDFDLVYVCDATLGMDWVIFPRVLNQALTIRLDVASALQASWAGPALAFGEIGELSDASAISRRIEGAVRVASSGPFSISLSSANKYQMTYPGGSPDDPQQRISYAASLLGRLASPQTPLQIDVRCRRTGLAGRNLPLSVRLLEGGTDKVAAPEYKDTLTVTVTPLAATYSGGLEDCS